MPAAMSGGAPPVRENDSRAGEKSRRGATLDTPIPPGEGVASVARALPVTGDYLRRLKIGRLESPRDYRRAMNKCIRAMARGTLPRELGTGLVWALTQAASEARKELEERVFEQLTRLEADQAAGGRLDHRPADDLTDEELEEIARRGRPALEVLPADGGKEEL